jgi:hypothetical protein
MDCLAPVNSTSVQDVTKLFSKPPVVLTDIAAQALAIFAQEYATIKRRGTIFTCTLLVSCVLGYYLICKGRNQLSELARTHAGAQEWQALVAEMKRTKQCIMCRYPFSPNIQDYFKQMNGPQLQVSVGTVSLASSLVLHCIYSHYRLFPHLEKARSSYLSACNDLTAKYTHIKTEPAVKGMATAEQIELIYSALRQQGLFRWEARRLADSLRQ